LSVFVALFVGTIEILGLIGQEVHAGGGFWASCRLRHHKAGFVIVGVFVLTGPSPWPSALRAD